MPPSAPRQCCARDENPLPTAHAAALAPPSQIRTRPQTSACGSSGWRRTLVKRSQMDSSKLVGFTAGAFVVSVKSP